MPEQASAFAGYSAPYLRVSTDESADKVQQLLWGDYVSFLGEETDDWIKVRGRNEDGWIKKNQLQANRLLEVNFIDIGQGDGTFIVTPDDKFLLIDAGQGDNMYRYLCWRFNLPADDGSTIDIQNSVMTHSDQDHYLGFKKLFESGYFTFSTVYHNGIVERSGSGSDILGPRTPPHQRLRYLTDIISDDETIRERLAQPDFVDGSKYATMLQKAAEQYPEMQLRALSADDRFLPGYENGHDLRIEVCGPVRETVDGKPAMRWFSGVGPTKNGHSVILRFVYKGVSILLGGDLNIPSENYLLSHYSGCDPESDDANEQKAIVAAAQPIFGADIAKACHHGSAEFTELFLRTANPIATVISSGDNEMFAHPRPDTLGATGKHGRGIRPLIFSTELSRSTKEYVENIHGLDERVRRLEQEVKDAETPEAKERAQRALNRALRNVAVYGMIALRTDGERVLIAYKLEKPAPSKREFDIYLLEPDEMGALTYVTD